MTEIGESLQGNAKNAQQPHILKNTVSLAEVTNVPDNNHSPISKNPLPSLMMTKEKHDRFSQDELHEVTPDIEAPHIQHIQELGNRVFVSDRLGYIDTTGKERRAAIVVSPQGEVLLHSHTKLLSAIDTGLQKDSLIRDSGETVEVGDGITMQYLGSGDQSKVYLIQITDEHGTITNQSVIKVKNNNEESEYDDIDVSQPSYIDEMLQIQSVVRDQQEILEANHVHVPRVYFATGHMICMEYIPGDYPTGEELATIVPSLKLQVGNYIQEQRRNNPYWEGIFVDLHDISDDNKANPFTNFKRTPDGKLYWIDMFAHIKPPTFVDTHALDELASRIAGKGMLHIPEEPKAA